MVERGRARLVKAFRNVVEGIAAGVLGGGSHHIGGRQEVHPIVEPGVVDPPAGRLKRIERFVHSSPFKMERAAIARSAAGNQV